MKTVPDKSQIVSLTRVGKKAKKKSDQSGVYTVQCTVQSQIGKVRSEQSDLELNTKSDQKQLA